MLLEVCRMDSSLTKCNQLAIDAQEGISKAYASSLAPVLARHQGTLHRIEELETAGQSAQARRLYRSSGLLDDLARAIANAGKDSGKLVRQMRADILGVMADDDGGETG